MPSRVLVGHSSWCFSLGDNNIIYLTEVGWKGGGRERQRIFPKFVAVIARDSTSVDDK